MGIANSLVDKSKDNIGRLAHVYNPRTWKEKGLLWSAGLALITYLVVTVILGIYWSREPSHFDVKTNALEMVNGDSSKLVSGFTTTAATIRIADVTLHKPGGFLRNDISLPSLYLDNMLNWEHGTINALRDMARVMRNDFSRSQSQSQEDKDLSLAQTLFNNDSQKWLLPSAESKYNEGIDALNSYLTRLIDERDQDGQFFTRADNLRTYLQEVEKRLGDFAQRLGASVGKLRYNLDLAGDPNAQQSTPTPDQERIKTPWAQNRRYFLRNPRLYLGLAAYS